MLSILGSERRLHWLSALAIVPALALVPCDAGAARQLQATTVSNIATQTGAKVLNPNTSKPIPGTQSECPATDSMSHGMPIARIRIGIVFDGTRQTPLWRKGSWYATIQGNSAGKASMRQESRERRICRKKAQKGER